MPHVIHLLASRTHDVASGNHMGRSGSFSCLRDTLAYLLGQSVLALDEELQVLSLGCRGNIIGACTMKLLFEFASIEVHSNCNAGAIQALIHRIMRLHSSLV